MSTIVVKLNDDKPVLKSSRIAYEERFSFQAIRWLDVFPEAVPRKHSFS
jgi:hypothetical protein